MRLLKDRNLPSLILIQGSNAIYPLIIIPYLFAQLGVVVFSTFVFYEVVIFYILSIALYGYDVTSVNKISRLKSENKITEIHNEFWLVTYSRVAILLVTLSLVGCFVYLLDNDNFYVLLTLFLYPLGVVLESAFYYQGMQKNAPLSLFVFVSRSAALVCIVLFVDSENDFHAATVIYGLGYLFSGIISISYLLVTKESVEVKQRPVFKDACFSVRDNWVTFVSVFSTLFYRNSNVLVLSAVSTPAAVAVYAVVEKYIRMMQALVRPLNQYTYPKLAVALNKADSSDVIKAIWGYTKLQLVFIVTIVVMFNLFSFIDYQFFDLVFDEKLFYLMLLMSIGTVFGVMNFMYGLAGMTILNLRDIFARLVVLTGVASVIFSVFLGYFYGEFGAGISFVLGEIILFSTSCAYLLFYSNREVSVGM